KWRTNTRTAVRSRHRPPSGSVAPCSSSTVMLARSSARLSTASVVSWSGPPTPAVAVSSPVDRGPSTPEGRGQAAPLAATRWNHCADPRHPACLDQDPVTWVVPLALGGIAIAVMALFTVLGAKKHRHGVGTAGRVGTQLPVPRVLVHDINDD